jgi:hypothetical protein
MAGYGFPRTLPMAPYFNLSCTPIIDEVPLEPSHLGLHSTLVVLAPQFCTPRSLSCVRVLPS